MSAANPERLGRDPNPIDGLVLRRALDAAGPQPPYKALLERVLLDLQESQADALMLLLKEGHGAWIPLLSRASGPALFVGNSLCGTVAALAYLGFEVTVVDPACDRLRLAARRDQAYTTGRTRFVVAGDSRRLPFRDGSFGLAVQEGGLPCTESGWGHTVDELWRVCRGEVLVTGDNRLAYKRSGGQRGQHLVPGPLGWLAALLWPKAGERSLWGYRRALSVNQARLAAYALYPHAREFSHVVALDRRWPRLTVGPKERRNRIKTAAARVGLFPVLTPSFAIHATPRTAEPSPSRAERVLSALAEHVQEPVPEIELLISTRSNNCLLQTAPCGASAGPAGEFEAGTPGHWSVHIPCSPPKERLLHTHAEFLQLLDRDFPALRTPRLLFSGRLEGLHVCCERRLPGLGAPQITGDRAATGRMLADVARDLALLVVEPAALLDEARFESMVGSRFALVRSLCAVESTRQALLEMERGLREALVGRRLPLVLYHADLRAKHVQVRPNGEVLGYLDWGASEATFLPYVDLLHLILHQRKQEEDSSPGAAWVRLRDRQGLARHELAAMRDYAERLGLDQEVCRGIERALPGLLAGMAERNWDYSRPRWVHSQYGI